MLKGLVFRREIVLPALLATAIFALLTCWTHYPFLVDDYGYLWRARLPEYSVLDFDYLLARRPLMVLLSYVTYGSGILEHTKAPFLIYYFFHGIGVLLTFLYVAKFFFPEDNLSKWDFFWIGALICVFPGWFEITLLALDLPYGLGAFFLGLSLWAERGLARTVLYAVSFLLFESYLFPAWALGALEFALGARSQWKKRVIPLAIASVVLFATQKLLMKGLGIQSKYSLVFSFSNAVEMAGTYIRLLYFQSFYKVNWVSTAIELSALAWALIAIIKKDRSWLLRVALLFLIPCLAAAHCLVMGSYLAPRAVHGAMVLRAVSTGILLIALIRSFSNAHWKWVPAAMVLLAYIGHHGLIVSNRSHNREVMSAKEAEVERELLTCQSPCRISLRGVEDRLYWDWYMQPGFHTRFVYWIKERMGVKKEVLAE